MDAKAGILYFDLAALKCGGMEIDMSNNRKLYVVAAVLTLSLSFILASDITANAGNYMATQTAGIAQVLDPGKSNPVDIINAKAKELNLTFEEPKKESNLVMANVKDALNVRSDASEEAEKVGKLYKDCGGTILERKDGWTRLKSGNIVGWASDEYLLFGDEAEALASDVGRMIATVDADTLRVRSDADANASIRGLLPKGDVVEVLDDSNAEWVCINYNGEDGYVSSEFVIIDFQIDAGETMEEIKAREAAEREAEMEAKRHVNYGQYTTDADTTNLLAALVQCEAGNQEYEGQLAVAAVVMNRVRSSAYPDSIHGVIYASGQFTPALNGKVNAVYDSGNINSSCIKAAQEALDGVSNVGDATHFRRNNGREGIVIGQHVFY